MSRLPSLALRNVLRNRRRSAVTLLAISVGVTAIIGLRGVSNGFIDMMIENVVEGKTGALQIHRAGYLDSLEANPIELSMSDAPALMARVAAVPGVRGVTGRIQFNGLVSNGRAQTMFVGRGLELSTEKLACSRAGLDVEPGGTPLAPGDGAVALVGGELARSFKAVPHKGADPEEVDSVSLSSASPGGRANALDVKVKGLTTTSVPFENKRVVAVPLAVAQELLGMEGKITEVAVGVHDLSELDRIVGQLRDELGPDYEVSTWTEIQPFLRDVIFRQRVILGMISTILLVIILSGIANTMLMSVFERTREIGTMLAVGVRRRQILTLFLLEAAVLGLFGGTIGAALGRAVVALLSSVGIPMKVLSASAVLRPTVSLEFMLLSVVVATAGALAAATYPSWKASRQNPVDALRSI